MTATARLERGPSGATRPALLRIIVASAAIAALLAWAATPIADALVPWYRLQIGWLAPEYQVLALENQKKQADTVLVLAVNFRRPVLAQGRLIMPDPRGRAEALTLAWAPLQSIAIVVVMLVAWPVRRPSEHVWRALAGALLLAALTACDVPVTLVAGIRDFYDPGGLAAHWAGLMARGGRLALALAGALAVIALAARMRLPRRAPALGVILAATLLGTAMPEAGAIVGGAAPDSPAARVDPNTTTSPWAGVGSVRVNGGVYSGALIGRRYVLTAAHVVAGAAPAGRALRLDPFGACARIAVVVLVQYAPRKFRNTATCGADEFFKPTLEIPCPSTDFPPHAVPCSSAAVHWLPPPWSAPWARCMHATCWPPPASKRCRPFHLMVL